MNFQLFYLSVLLQKDLLVLDDETRGRLLGSLIEIAGSVKRFDLGIALRNSPNLEPVSLSASSQRQIFTNDEGIPVEVVPNTIIEVQVIGTV